MLTASASFKASLHLLLTCCKQVLDKEEVDDEELEAEDDDQVDDDVEAYIEGDEDEEEEEVGHIVVVYVCTKSGSGVA